MKKIILKSGLAVWMCLVVMVGSTMAQTRISPVLSYSYQYQQWPNNPPAACPYAKSNTIKGIVLTGRFANYSDADSWYPMWASDGNLYSSYEDGFIYDFLVFALPIESFKSRPATGNAKIIGDNPLQLQVVNLGRIGTYCYQEFRNYPCASAVFNGVWYYGVDNNNLPDGKFQGYRFSSDFDHFVDDTTYPCKNNPYWTDQSTSAPNGFFNDTGYGRLRKPYFADLGKNNEDSPDGKAYLVSHGNSEGPSNWSYGKHLYLARVDTTKTAILDPHAYEFFAGNNPKGAALWTKDIKASKPLLSGFQIPGGQFVNLGLASITYDKPLKKYLLCTKPHNQAGMIFESDHITGPYILVQYLDHFGPDAYSLMFPSKFISADGKRLWLLLSANYENQSQPGNPLGCHYSASFHEVLLDIAGEKIPEPPAQPELVNIAPQATVTASSVMTGTSPTGAVDHIFGVDSPANEWVSNGEKAGAWIKLAWNTSQRIDRIRLYDRANLNDQVMEGTVVFSDGSGITPSISLPNNGRNYLELSFPARTVSWVKFTVNTVISGEPPRCFEFTPPTEPWSHTTNIGLSEFEVFQASKNK